MTKCARGRLLRGAGLVLAASLVLGPGCGSGGRTLENFEPVTWCRTGVPLGSLDQSGVSAALRAAIRDPGPVIGRWLDGEHTQPNPAYPSGRVVVLPFETPDYPRNPAVTASLLFTKFFAKGPNAGVSARLYFLENSYGAFDMTNAGIANWVTLPDALTAYTGFEGDLRLPRDVLEQATIDWSVLDTNHDEVITPAEVQLVFVVSNGYSAAARGFIDMTGSAGPVTVPEIVVDTPAGVYTFRPPVVYLGTKTASAPDAAIDPIRILSTIPHELAHAFFNLPDRYLGPCGSGITGAYDLMSDNCTWHHMNPHDKIKIGWLEPVILNGHVGTCVALPASESTPAAVVLVHSDPAVGADEYWIVENRHRPSSGCSGCTLALPPLDVTGIFDAGLPESGLAVWWVRFGTWTDTHDEVRLVDATLPDQDPDGTTPLQGTDPGYRDQGPGALFVRDVADPQKLLLDSAGAWSLRYFRRVSKPGPVMYVEL